MYQTKNRGDPAKMGQQFYRAVRMISWQVDGATLSLLCLLPTQPAAFPIAWKTTSDIDQGIRARR